jgi:hypothetical protein
MSGNTDIRSYARATDADRNDTITKLQEGLTAGAIDTDVFYARLDVASTTYDTEVLAKLTSDLRTPRRPEAVVKRLREDAIANPAKPDRLIRMETVVWFLFGFVPSAMLTFGSLEGGWVQGGSPAFLCGVGLAIAIVWLIFVPHRSPGEGRRGR